MSLSPKLTHWSRQVGAKNVKTLGVIFLEFYHLVHRGMGFVSCDYVLWRLQLPDRILWL
jgi:hypothetical protein